MTRLKRHRAPRRQWVCHARALPGAALKPIPLHPQRDRAGPPKRGKPTAPKLFRPRNLLTGKPRESPPAFRARRLSPSNSGGIQISSENR